MKPLFTFFLTLVLLPGLNGVHAADNAPPHVETRIVVGGPGHAAMAAAREPVTYLGVAVAPADPALASQLRLPEGQGLVVTLVEPEGPAARAGLRQHDVLTKLDDQILIEPRQLSVLVRGRAENDQVTISYLRAGSASTAKVTLGKHTPAAGFRWIGEGGPDVLFRTEDFNLPGPGPRGAGPLPHVQVRPHPLPHPAPGVGGERVMIFRPRANIVVADEAGEMVVRIDDGKRVLTAKDPAGTVIFDGPIDTPEQRAALPEALQQRLKKLEARDVLDFSEANPDRDFFTVPAARASGDVL